MKFMWNKGYGKKGNRYCNRFLFTVLTTCICISGDLIC
jgi:hypothetical protein